MGTREVSPRHRDELAASARAVRDRWRSASLATGWPFPSDWAIPEVDAVCAAALRAAELTGPLARLGRARATAGAGLAETLRDVAALHAVLATPRRPGPVIPVDPDAVPAWLLRVTAVGWADELVHHLGQAEVSDALTGLATPAYLRTRLHEVYRESRCTGGPPGTRYALAVFAPDLTGVVGWSRLTVMVLLADVLRGVFDGGQTLVAAGTSTLVVLAERDGRLPTRVAGVRLLAAERFRVDPALRAVGAPAAWVEYLPDTHEAACGLLARLGRTPD